MNPIVKKIICSAIYIFNSFDTGKRSMSGIIWHWTEGDKKIFTRKIDIVDKAMSEGYYVMPMIAQSHTFKPDDFE